MTVTMKAPRAGSATATFKITPADISGAIVTADDQVYDGTEIKPTPTVTWNGKTLDAGKDFEVTGYANNVHAGSATVTVTGKGNFKNSSTASGTFEIAKRPATITVDDASKIQGEDDPVFTGAVEGLVADGDLGEVSYVRMNDDEAPGTYEGVLIAEYMVNDDYDVNVTKGNFTIKKQFTVVWLDGDGSVLQTKTYGEGDEPPAYDGKTPAKAATAQYTYSFTGWDDGTVDGTTTTYEPQFSETVNEYTVRFVNDDGTELQSGKVAYGQIPEYKGKTPEKAATAQCTYTFKGWDKEIAAVTGDATYTATYTETAKKGALTFDYGGGTIDGKTSLTIEANVGDTITIPKAPVRDGYTFKYWKGSEYYPGDKYTVEGDHTFTAVWEKKSDDNGNGNGSGGSGNGSNGSSTKGTSAPSTGVKGSSPSTGDTSGEMVTSLSVAAVCALCLVALALCQRRRRSSGHSSKHLKR